MKDRKPLECCNQSYVGFSLLEKRQVQERCLFLQRANLVLFVTPRIFRSMSQSRQIVLLIKDRSSMHKLFTPTLNQVAAHKEVEKTRDVLCKTGSPVSILRKSRTLASGHNSPLCRRKIHALAVKRHPELQRVQAAWQRLARLS